MKYLSFITLHSLNYMLKLFIIKLNNFKLMSVLDKINKEYTWDDTVQVILSSWMTIPINLWDNKDAEFLGYHCTSCSQPTTLADWQCGSCWSPFEVLDITEAKSIFPDIKIKAETPSRLAYLLNHRWWICGHCESYNTNYPREEASYSNIHCVNCANSFDEKSDILLEDSDVKSNWLDSVDNFKEKVLHIVEKHKNKWNWNTRNTHRSKDTSLQRNYKYNTPEHTPFSNPITRNKLKILAGALWAGIVWYILHYGLIEEIDKEIKILGHDWERVVNIEEYKEQTWSGWEEKINSSSYDDFQITSRVDKEAPWDSYDVQIWTKSVTDYSNCTWYDSPSEQCSSTSVTLSSGVTVDWPDSCYTPSKSCVSYWDKDVPVMETRYHEHPYVTYDYMDWENTEDLFTWWHNKKPYWHNTDWYTFDGVSVRLWLPNEDYSVDVIDKEGNKESVRLPENTWNKINKWDSCPVKATRWWWIKGDSLIQWVQQCTYE